MLTVPYRTKLVMRIDSYQILRLEDLCTVIDAQRQPAVPCASKSTLAVGDAQMKAEFVVSSYLTPMVS